MFDFPNAPAIGDRVTGVGGIVYVWDGVKWTSSVGAVTVQSMGDVGRNLLHNSMFNVAQRGAGPWTVSAFTLDRWLLQSVTDTVTVNQVVLADANRAQIGDEAAAFCMQTVVTGNAAAGALTTIQHRIEDVRRLAGKTVTVSFWAVAGSALKLGVNMVQDFGTGGSPSAAVQVLSTGIAIQLGTSWARYTATIAIPSISSKTLGSAANNYTRLEFWYSAGANANVVAGNIGVQSGTIQLWGVQLEIGSVATPLEKPDPQVDLANCQRFYQSGGNARVTAYQTAGNGAAVTQSLPVSMRAIPTISTKDFTSSNISNAGLTALDPSTIQIFTGTFTASGTGYVQMNYTASADL